MQATFARRRRNRALLEELELPDAFDLSTLVEQVARRRGRPIHLEPVHGAMADGSPCGWWCPTPGLDLIFVDATASAPHRKHIVLHEVGHMLWGHDPVLATLVPVLERVTSHLRWDSEAIISMLGRSGYDSPREQEAEVFATVAGLKITKARRSQHEDAQDDVARLSRALYPRGRT